MMDLSDGLSKDCRTLAHENNLGIILDLNPSLLPETMVKLGKDIQRKPLEWVINGGEEYELLFAASPSFTPSSVSLNENTGFFCIGEFTNDYKGLYLRTESGLAEIKTGGWDHI
jgi:thiamine-monophosphate kinase